MVYILTLFRRAGFLKGKVFFGVDGTELASKITSYPLNSVEIMINGKKEKISIYNQLDVDCGERRNKSDKSKFFVGYKVHTLTVVDSETKIAFPLISLVAPANHHDSNFLWPLLLLGQSIGLDIGLVIADQGYNGRDVDLMDSLGVTVLTQSQTRVSEIPNVVTVNGVVQVYMSGDCEHAMDYLGRTGRYHEFRCSVSEYSCPFSSNCPRHREIEVDNGNFGVIPKVYEEVSKLESTRKVIERPFNLLKHRNGQDRIPLKSQTSSQSAVLISTLAILLIEIAGVRRRECTSELRQSELQLLVV